MNLKLDYAEFCNAINGKHLQGPEEGFIQQIQYDTRKIFPSPHQAFFALNGEFRNGHTFIADAYKKGIRIFVVSEKNVPELKNATFILVKNTLHALQDLAAHHRQKFSYPIIGITGSVGKTTVKEWLYHLLSDKFRIVRSPKSYNSQLGVALSLLNLHDECDLAIIEAGISKPGEMQVLEGMIQPTIGILTTVSQAHAENFASYETHLAEKTMLFQNAKKTIVGPGFLIGKEQLEVIHGYQPSVGEFAKELQLLPFKDKGSVASALLAIATAKLLKSLNKDKIASLPRLALRLETFEGRENAFIINDTYNLDLDALNLSLEYQLELSEGKKRIVIVGLEPELAHLEARVVAEIEKFQPDEIIVSTEPKLKDEDLKNAVVLVKGSRNAHMEKVARALKLKQHKTEVIYNLSAIKHNIGVHKQFLLPKTKMLAMVKAQSYGVGLEKMAAFLEKIGVSYLGVAYSDEGVELRKSGIKIPILVMNPEEEGFDACIKYNLEPAIYSLTQLDELISTLISLEKTNFPIHIKLDTGMRRLGFEREELPKLMEVIQAQPEVRIAGVYSHLADADNRRDVRFTNLQISRFQEACQWISQHVPYAFIRHLLNSEGITNFKEAQFDMVRIGVGMYGVSSNKNLAKFLHPVLQWKSEISQIKTIKPGESIGYSRSFVAEKQLKIAIVPVGYADGFRRSLSNGKGGVYVKDTFCPVLGKVCMDMIIIDVSKLQLSEGDEVEIIGKNQSIEQLASKMDTIPYEVMTSISKRVHRSYAEEE
ncbi:MAG: alanine racemase [Flavobacteriales bacterium]|nr:alanine racemase [Flavobacteriales bacterium]